MCDDRVKKPCDDRVSTPFSTVAQLQWKHEDPVTQRAPVPAMYKLWNSPPTVATVATEMSRLATDPGSVWTRTGSWFPSFPSDGLLKSVNHFSVQSMIQTSWLSLESVSGLGVFSTSNGAWVLALHQHTNMLMVHDGAIWNLVVVPRLQGGCYSILLNLDINLIEWVCLKKGISQSMVYHNVRH